MTFRSDLSRIVPRCNLRKCMARADFGANRENLVPIDYERIKAFVDARPARKYLADVLHRATFTISWIESDGPQLWGFCLKLTSEQRKLFGTSREVLVWVSEF